MRAENLVLHEFFQCGENTRHAKSLPHLSRFNGNSAMTGDSVGLNAGRLRRALGFFAAAQGRGLADIARGAGIDPQRFEQILQDKIAIAPIEALRLAMEIDTTPDRLFSGIDSPVPALNRDGLRFYQSIANAVRNTPHPPPQTPVTGATAPHRTPPPDRCAGKPFKPAERRQRKR
jgi:hypothetical protein